MKLKDTLKNILVPHLSALAKRCVITGFDEFGTARLERRALLSYLVLPLLLPPALRDRVKFSNRGIAQEIPRVLNELGYIVDIVNFDNRSWVPSQPYDLFIGHGGMNFERFSKALSKTTIRIYFSTGLYWRTWNIRLAKRLYDLSLRRGYALPAYRAISDDEEFANRAADGIICLGNKAAVDSYSMFSHVVGINNAVFPPQWEGWRDKDYAEGRNHFLFFSGRGSILKGLDLLLEVFSRTQLHLHICHHMEPDFSTVYRRELAEFPNIHVYGFVKMRSPQFQALAKRCNWIISATCNEGQPGALLEGMAYGLIPIAPSSANIDLEDWGIRLFDCEIETIASIARQASEIPAEECERRAARIMEVTRTIYSVKTFRENFKAALNEICAVTEAKRHGKEVSMNGG